MENQNEENERSKTGSDNPVNSSGESGSKPLAHIVAPEKLELQLSVKNLPRPVARAIVNLAKRRKPESGLKTFLKDFLPALTPAATVLISIVALIYTVQQKNRAEAAAKLASLAAERKTLADIIDTFGKTVVPGSTTQSDQQREAHLEVAAMKFATYGDQVLPAMRMALGARDDGLRHGGVLVAQEMYRAKTVEPSKLASQILSYYRVNGPILQLGVLQWLDKMGRELSTNDSRQALSMLKESFRLARAKLCQAGQQCGAGSGRLSVPVVLRGLKGSRAWNGKKLHGQWFTKTSGEHSAQNSKVAFPAREGFDARRSG